MDESSLEEAIKTYCAQLQQVEVALSSGLGSAEQADLQKLKEDLQQLIELTESSLVSVKKSLLLASLEDHFTNQSVSSVTHETFKENTLGDEFAAFYSELTENPAEVRQNVEPDDEQEENGVEQEDLSGTKVQAPYRTSWGTLEYHNAMVVCPEEPEGDEARVRVFYLHPTNKSMKACGFYLEDKCRFLDNCRYSHGDVVCVSELRDFLEADISNMESGSACLAKHEDGIWYPARISEIEGGFYTVKFNSLLLKEAVLEADGVIPPLRQDDSSSSDSEDDSDQWNGGYAKGLGKTLSGRVEPVQAVVLPKGNSLDQCAELTQRKKAAAIAKDSPASRKPKTKTKKASVSTRRNVFDFLNSKLSNEAQPVPHSSRSSVAGAEAYRGGKSTKRSLNVRLFQATEKVAQVEKEIQRLTESLRRRNGRDATVVSRIEEKLAASRNLLEQLKAQERVDDEKPVAKQDKTKTRRKCKPKPLTGAEVVDILTKKKHLGEHEFYSLKASDDCPYRPYDLHVVPHSAGGRDYYNFSPTTVIHVQDGCSIELWTLAGWYQESLLWEAVRQIPFFRDFLLRKTFKRNLQKELSQAEQALQRLGNLSALADCMIVQNLVTISKQEVNSFLNNVLKRDQEQQGALFHTEIVFGADGQLTVFPPLHSFQEVLLEALVSVPNSVLQVFDSCSLSLDFEVRLPSGSMFISDTQYLTAGSTIDTIDKDVQKLLCEDLQSRSENLISELTEAVEVMKSEPNTFDSFTAFSKVVKHSVNMSDDLKKRLEDLLSLQETVQRNYTHMAPDGGFLMKQNTLQILQGFSKLLPVLSKLTSLMLNQKHWRNISKGIGLLYDPRKLTLGELMSKELQENQNRINKIYMEAKAEADMEQAFKTLQRHWKGAVFRHYRFIIVVPQQQSPQEGDAKEKNTSHSSVTCLSAPKHHIKDGETFTILDKLLDIFERFQHKWVFLSKTFIETSAITEQYELQEKFHPVDKMFRDIIRMTVKDPHIFSFLQLKFSTEANHGFQGQSLYTVLINGLTTMEEISSQLLFVIESARMSHGGGGGFVVYYDPEVVPLPKC
ncbi:Zinc finger CCCH-type with G patch domain-containing protein [Triplophysa tibetana]|uniref:Zinc finger CCCH-type with G patch domain-containing protein n=1 Tax=Triplophysa tibetana TaxID=1572043 RepID=A0A5A9NFK3_9TELE|nr:Zinc finger CCCH-type with G patch domain-containing protein [Triplophysa tibetana]